MIRLGGRKSAVSVAAVALFVICLLWGACGSSPTSTTGRRDVTTTSAQPEMTQVVMASPIGPDGKIAKDYRVKATLSGATCTAGSEVVGSVGYRCFGAQIVADPCWDERTGSVLCLAEPWSEEVTRLMISGALPKRPAADANPAPWAIEVNGNRCLAAQGAHDNVGEEVVDYRCSGDVVVLRGIDRSAPVWRAQAAKATVTGTYERLRERVPITTAWFGKA